MDPISAIHLFLDGVARRLRRRAAWLGMGYFFAAVGSLTLIGALLGHWIGYAPALAMLIFFLGTGMGMATLIFGFVLPHQKWRHRARCARFVGMKEPVGSDLLSSVELASSQHARGSDDLRSALFASTAQRLEALELQRIVSYREIRRPYTALVGLVIAGLLLAIASPATIAHGWNRLLRGPSEVALDGAHLFDGPLVGDLDIRIDFPDYTGKPSLHLPSSSGDFAAMPGSTIAIVARVLADETASGTIEKPRDIQSVHILMSDSERVQDSSENGMELRRNATGTVVAETRFEARKETYYRFAVDDGGKRRVEAQAHRIHMRPDRSPTIELFAPADELDVAKIKRIELAYIANDDFGIRKVELVAKSADGKEFRQSLEVPLANPAVVPAGAGAQNRAQMKYLWELAELPLRPGVQIEYYLEVTDNDDVLGPNVAQSKRFHLRLFSPRERHEDLAERQRVLAEHMIELLGARLTVSDKDLDAHLKIARDAGAVVVALGGLVAAYKGDELASSTLRDAVESLRDRMDKRREREDKLLEDLEQRVRSGGELTPGHFKRMNDSDTGIVAELEEDVLMVSDWLQRLSLENLLGLSDEVKDSQQRLEKLFEEYKRTGSAEVLTEIERELRVLEKRLQEMSKKSASIPEDVLDRFVNNDALQQEAELDCLGQVRSLLAEGNALQAQQQMQKCNEELDESAEALENALSGLRSESFSEEEKAFEGLMNELAELSQDQKDIAAETDRIHERYADAVSKLKDEKATEDAAKAGAIVAKLKQKIAEVPRAGLSPFSREEKKLLEHRLGEVEKMLKRGDLAEALGMAKYAKRSLDVLQEELELSIDEAWSRAKVTAERAIREGQPLAQELVEQLEAATPSPSDIMSDQDKDELNQLRKRQQSTRARSQKLLKKVQAQSKTLPGKAGQEMQEGVGKAVEHMQRSAQQMRRRDTSSARQEASSAADMLGKAQKNARGAARQQQRRRGQSWRDDPVRIPGAEDHKTPQQFREEILEAMEDKSAPQGYSEQVKQYYKDIIQ